MRQQQSFRQAYVESTRDVLRLFDEHGLAQMGLHNPGWGPGRFDVRAYLEASVTRYELALELTSRATGRPLPASLLDAGGFMATFPLALARLGVEVTITEKFSYYEGAFDELAELLEHNGIKIADVDITEPLPEEWPERYELVTCMAMLEHLAHSPKVLMDNLRGMLGPQSVLILEVPNIAVLHRRVHAATGRSVHPPLRDVYDARIPFTGHHREYTAAELRELIEWSSLQTCELVLFDYTPSDHMSALTRLRSRGPQWWKGGREVIMASARMSDPVDQ